MWMNHAGKTNEKDGGKNLFQYGVVGQWTLLIYDYNGMANKTDGNGWTRFDILNNDGDKKVTIGDNADIAFIAFFDSKAEIYEYYGEYVDAYLGEDKCGHYQKNYVSTSDPLVYESVCSFCGKSFGTTNKVNQEHLTVLTPSDLKDKIAPQATDGKGDFAALTLATDYENGNMPYLHMSFTRSHSGESFLNLRNITNVGKYVAIVYRNRNVNAHEMFIAGSGDIAGGQNINKTTPEYVKDTDGGWTLGVFDFSAKTNWSHDTGISHIRWDINNSVTAASYLDIAYLAFFNSQAEAEKYFNTYAKEYGFDDQISYVANLDHQYYTVNGVAGVSGATTGSIRTFGSHITINYTGQTSVYFKSVTFGGWLLTPSGVASYNYRVVSVDGVAVENPELVFVRNGNDSSTVYNAVIKDVPHLQNNYTEDAAKGASFQGANVINLKAYIGQTVNVQIVAVTNNGDEIVCAYLTNITVSVCEHANTVKKSAKAATESLEGCVAHLACADCGQALAEDGVTELDSVATPKLVPGTEKYFGYDYWSKAKVAGNGAGKTETIPSDDRSYVRFKRTGNFYDGVINFMSGNSDVTGQYMILKYRTDHMSEGQFWANTTENGPSGGQSRKTVSYNAEDEWTIVIIDLSKLIPDYVKESNGTYTIKWARIDLLDTAASSGYFDIAYLAFADDINDFNSILQPGDVLPSVQ